MSWPADNKPRYTVVSTTGYRTLSGGYGTSAGPGVSYAVLDRAHNHQAVQIVRSEDFSGWFGARRHEMARLQAEAEASHKQVMENAEITAIKKFSSQIGNTITSTTQNIQIKLIIN